MIWDKLLQAIEASKLYVVDNVEFCVIAALLLILVVR